MHSVWSDGRDSIETMVRTCRDLGYEYVAITDHSPRFGGLTQTLTVQNVRRQAEEIAALRERFPDIAILHGCEVDILPEGRLDFPDRVLERVRHRAGVAAPSRRTTDPINCCAATWTRCVTRSSR